LKNHIEKYLKSYAEKEPWRLAAKSFDSIQNAVVIPSLAEYPAILETLYSLSLNSPVELRKTLVVCVVNNRAFPQATEDEIANNKRTLLLLHGLLQERTLETAYDKQKSWIAGIKNSEMRLAYVDASSSGLELPEKGGVGLARKIGMDLCLAVLEYTDMRRNLLLSLDADTLVEPNYLSEVNSYFSGRKKLAAVVSFAHRKSENSSIQEAIAYYEAYLRYYVIALKYAHSPYAFHTIGSTIVSSAEGYAMVRGMPKRLAAEDFYLLNKLAKIQPMGFVDRTTVYPSPRLSTRTPFGTGKKIGQLIAGEEAAYLFYNPEIFAILGKWLTLIERRLDQKGETILAEAEKIDPGMPAFLNQVHFLATWEKLKKNYPLQSNLLKQFHAWFDGFKTLKLIHYLTEHGHPKISAFKAVAIMSSMVNINMPGKNHINHDSATDMPAYLKAMEKAIQKPGAMEISP
jgi:hypothetical protein